MSKSPYRRASQSRPLLGKSDCFIQSPCSRQRIFIRVPARLQATAAPEAPEPIISTSTIWFLRRPLSGDLPHNLRPAVENRQGLPCILGRQTHHGAGTTEIAISLQGVHFFR